MSAYVVDPKTINHILTYCKDQKRSDNAYYINKALEGVEWSLDSLPDLGQAMYNMNINAVSQRYPDSSDCGLPGTMVSMESNELVPFLYRSAPCGAIRAYKALQCYLYQCSEGNVEDHPLFKAFTTILNSIASQIVRSLPEYDKAEWA